MDESSALPVSQEHAALSPSMTKKKRKVWPWIVLGFVLAIGAGAYFMLRPKPVVHRWLTGTVSRGDVTETIEATGTVQAIVQVQVSSQVSGRISALHADFNSQVHAGDVLAEIDPTPFRARLAQSQAALQQAIANERKAQSDLALAQANGVRARAMRERELNAQSDLDIAVNAEANAQAQVGVARANVAQARAALTSAQTDLDYTRILAPIDGLVITRSIDVGATVAASFSAPILFVIVDDLARMQIIGDVDEAEIGKLQTLMNVDVRVDAFPDQVFHGRIRELRYGSTVTQGFVTYRAVSDVDNPSRALRPGMTAAISVTTAHAVNALRVPNAALRFSPPEDVQAQAGGGPPGQRGANAPASARRPRTSHDGIVWVLEGRAPNTRLRRVQVVTGATDGRYTEVTSGPLNPSHIVVLDDASATGPAGGAPRRGPRIL